MNRIINRSLRAGSVVCALSLVAVPAVGSALGVRDGSTPLASAPKAATVSKSGGGFCNSLSNYSSSITSKMSGLTGKVTQAWSQQDQKLASEAQAVDQKVTAARQTADAQRQADFTKLEAKATTGTELQAVKGYETAVNNAVNTRRAAYDAARTAFRDGVKSAIMARRSNVSSQEAAFESAVNSAIATAQAGCGGTAVSADTVRADFISSLKTARQTFESDRGGDSKIGDQVKQLIATRDAAFKAADQAFQASLKTARQTLEQAFGKTTI